jgi:hypothetical protein
MGSPFVARTCNHVIAVSSGQREMNKKSPPLSEAAKALEIWLCGLSVQFPFGKLREKLVFRVSPEAGYVLIDCPQRDIGRNSDDFATVLLTVH